MAKFRMPFPDKFERLAGDDFFPEGTSLTKQSEAEACDINAIMARYVNTGVIEHVRENPGAFRDLPMQVEYHDACNLVKAAESSFALLPAEIRAQFDNSPVKFLQFADASDQDVLERLGIVAKREEMAAESADVVRADVLPGQMGLPGTGTPDVPPAVKK